MSPRINLDPALTNPVEERPERRDAAENRQLLLDAAAHLFDQEGVGQVNMADIAKEACVGKGTLYRRFQNKGDICLSLLSEKFRRFQDRMLGSMREMTGRQISPFDQLLYFFDEQVDFIYQNLDLMIEIDRASSTEDAEDINTPHFWMQLTVRGLLNQAAAADELRPDLDLDYLTSALLAPLDGRILRDHQVNRGFTREQIKAGLNQLLDGLRRSTP